MAFVNGVSSYQEGCEEKKSLFSRGCKAVLGFQ
jgi:hypothetical protein